MKTNPKEAKAEGKSGGNYSEYLMIKIFSMIRFSKQTYSVVYTGFRGWGRSRQPWGGVLCYLGEFKNFAFFKLGNFQKNFKTSMKNLQF